jgi:hypothetical protein
MKKALSRLSFWIFCLRRLRTAAVLVFLGWDEVAGPCSIRTGLTGLVVTRWSLSRRGVMADTSCIKLSGTGEHSGRAEG